MKSFKQFLTEMESPEASGSQQRNPVPPGSIPPPKMPAPTRLDPGSLPPGHDRPDGQGSPGNVDWQDVDEEMQGLLNIFRQLMQLLRTLSWEQFVEYMRLHYGNTNLGDGFDIQDWFRDYTLNYLKRWFRDRYPDHTNEQWYTFIQKIFDEYNYELWEIYDREYFPSDVPDNETPQEGPSQRDRDRAAERWDRQHP